MSDAAPVMVQKLADRTEIPAASRILAEALQDEPGFSFVVPDSGQRRIVLQTLLSRVVRDAFPLGNVWIARVGPEIAGTAVWYAPGDYPLGMWRNLRMAPGMLGHLRVVGARTLQTLGQMDQNARSHFPDAPCWYLSALGVAPGHQGTGVGSGLVRAALAEIERRGEPAYLETGEERNVRFYERLGFEVREAGIQIAPPPGPTHWTMWREPR